MGMPRFVFGIIAGPLFRVGQDLVGLHQGNEFLRIPRVEIIGMILPGQQPVNPFYGLLVCHVAQLKDFIIIDKCLLPHMLDLPLAAFGPETFFHLLPLCSLSSG
jgi:hypothetical protein